MYNFHLRIQKSIILSVIILSSFLYITIRITYPHNFSKQVYYFFHSSKSISCYHVKTNSLQDISDIKPKKGKSIFFHETSCNSHREGKIVISARQACAVESASKMNKNLDIYLLFTSPGEILLEGTESDNMIEDLMNIENVHLLHVDYEKYTRNSPIEDLYQSGKIEYSNYALSHSSDVLRYLTLWKYGGIYLDLDIIVIKSLENLGMNFAGQESDNNVAAGVLGFAPAGIGHHLANTCLHDLKENFRGDTWGYNGPGVITRLLQNICGVENAKDMLNKDCQGFKVYPKQAFYPVPWWNWTMYFDKMYSQEVFNLAKNSYAIHVWNQHSKSTEILIGSKAPYTVFARKYCPKVYSRCKKYF